MLSLSWQYNVFSSHNSGYIQIEEVEVQYSLKNTSNNSNDVIESFKVIAVDPVEDVQGTVRSKSKQVMGGYAFSFSCFRYHEQLRKNGNTLKIDREGPEHFHYSKLMVENKS